MGEIAVCSAGGNLSKNLGKRDNLRLGWIKKKEKKWKLGLDTVAEAPEVSLEGFGLAKGKVLNAWGGRGGDFVMFPLPNFA